MKTGWGWFELKLVELLLLLLKFMSSSSSCSTMTNSFGEIERGDAGPPPMIEKYTVKLILVYYKEK